MTSAGPAHPAEIRAGRDRPADRVEGRAADRPRQRAVLAFAEVRGLGAGREQRNALGEVGIAPGIVLGSRRAATWSVWPTAMEYDTVRVAIGLANMADDLRKHAAKTYCPRKLTLRE